MKITKLRIQGYKNIQNLTIDFADGLNYAAFVGLNGSGKSNIIEAVSLFFKHVYTGSWRNSIGFFFEAIIVNNNTEIILTKNGRGLGAVGENAMDNIPSNVIACYSGEETRLYDDIYKQNYQNYFDQIKSFTQKPDYPQMVYLDKTCWEICTITMLCSDTQSVKSFVKKIFGDLDLATVGISFSIDLPKGKNVVIDFVNKLYLEQNAQSVDGYVSVEYIRSMEVNFEKLSVKDIFYYLFMSYVPKEIQGANKLIKDLQLHGLDIKSLSEGEKKQILITFINEILADENSLVLLDEPDAHWHIERQKELAKSVACQQHFTILTTHSPILSKFLDIRSIYMLSNTSNGVELVDKQNICVINELSSGELSIQEQNVLITSNKHILLVEGKTDIDYIQKAIDILKISLEFEFIPCGGASGVSLFINKFKPNQNQKVIIILDHDVGLGQVEKTLGLEIDSLKNISSFKNYRDNIYFLPLPQPGHISDSNYMIEDYFPIEKKSNIATKLLNNFKTTCNFKIDPKKIKEKINEEYKNYTEDDFQEFKKLFDLINEIVNLNNTTPAYEQAALFPQPLAQITNDNINSSPSLAPSNQIKIFANYAPRGHEKEHYDAIFDRTDKSVFYNGERYSSANKTMKNIRLAAGGNRFANAKKFWKYRDESGKVRYLFELL